MKTNNSVGEYLRLIEGEIVNENNSNLSDSLLNTYFKESNNSWMVDFVGVIFKKTDKVDKTIMSFPRNYFASNLENETISKEDIKILENTLINICKFDNESFDVEYAKNFPVNAYLDVCKYFKKYGLYHKDVTRYYKGYGGQIDWKRTVAASNKILNNKNLLFLPFVNKKVEYEEVFITECMNYVLSDGYNCFGQFFNIGIKYQKSSNNKLFQENRAKLIKKLVILKRAHFKNTEIKLIDNIIKYIKWLSIKNQDVVVITKNFELVWKVMINDYLNKFFNYDLIEERIYFDKRNLENHNKFIKNFQNKEEFIDKKVKDIHSATDTFLLIDDKKRIAVLLEAEYYKMKEDCTKNLTGNSLDIFHNILIKYLKKQGKENYKIINGRILPSFENRIIMSTISNDTIEGKESKKYECYLKVKDVLKYYNLKQ